MKNDQFQRSVVAAVMVLGGSATASAQSLDAQLLYDSRYDQLSASPPSAPYANIGLAFASAANPPVSFMELEDSDSDFITMDSIGGWFYQGNVGSAATRAGLLEQMPSGGTWVAGQPRRDG